MSPPDAVDPARARDFGGRSVSRSFAKSYDVACERAGLVARVVLARVDNFGRDEPGTGRSRLPGLSGDLVRAESRLGEKGLDVCYRGWHTQNPQAVPYTNGINRMPCLDGPYGCAARRLTHGMGRQLFTTDLCMRK